MSRGVEVGRAVETMRWFKVYPPAGLPAGYGRLLHFIYIRRCIQFSHIGNRVEKPD